MAAAMFRTAFLANHRLNARKYTTSKGNGVALVTGGTGGLGREFARKALSWGSTHVVLIDVIESPNLTEFDSSKVSYIRCDVSQLEDLRQAFQAAADRGPLRLVCNNAGIGDEIYWRKQIDVNLGAVIGGTYMGIEHMRKHGQGGFIVNVASLGGVIPQRFCPTYSATKAGVIGFTRSLDMLHSSDKIHVSAICPGYTDTPFIKTAGMSPDRAGEGFAGMLDSLQKTIAASGGAIAAQQVGSALGDILDGKFQAGSAVMCIAKGNMAMRFPMGDAVGEPLLHFKS